MRSLLLVLLVLSSALPAHAEEARRKRTRMAVPEVTPRAGIEPGSLDGLAAVLAEEAGKQPGLDVVSAAEIRAMIGLEKQKALLGCSDASCLAEIGGALGVDLLLTSEVSRIGGQWLVSVSLVDVRKSRVVARATKDSPYVDALVSTARDAVKQLLEVLAPPPSTAWTGGEIASVASVGGGAALAIVGGILLAIGSGEVADAVGGSGTYDANAKAKEESGKNKETAGTLLLIAGGGAVVGGAVAWPFTGGGEAATFSLAPRSGGGRLAWSLRF